MACVHRDNCGDDVGESVPQIDDRVVVDDDLGVVIVSRETFWC